MGLVRRFAVVAVLLGLMASCGGGSDETQAPVTVTVVKTEGSSQATETQPTLSEAEAKVLAASMNLRLTDFPSGWRADPPEETGECAGIQKLSERFVLLAHEDSKDFSEGDSEASSSAGLFNDEATAREALNYEEGAVQSSEFRDCLDRELRKRATSEVTFGDIKIGQVSFPKFGERSSAWEIAITGQTSGLSITVYLDVVFVLQSNALAVVEFTDVGTPFDEQMREHLVGVVVDRMKKATQDEL
jgi:hypothetical protein